CVCAWTKPGGAKRPARSMTSVREPRSASASAVDPTWTIRSPRMATACASGSAGSTVHTRPPWMTRSAASAVELADATPRVAAGAIEIRDDENDDEYEEQPAGVLAKRVRPRRGDEPCDRES